MADISFKRKKTKKIKLNFEDVEDSGGLDTKNCEEILDIKILREGLLILGCVTSIEKTSVTLSLPGCISGVVEANSISNAFSETVICFSENSDSEEPAIASFFEVGMVYPCKIIKIESDSNHKKMNIFVSINPDDVNANLKPSSLYLKMVLYVSIYSIEDHGYVVNIGTECLQGFLPKQNCGKNENLKVGQVIPTFIQKILFSGKSSAKVQLVKLDFNQEFPKVSVENIKLHSILPGAKISADVIEVNKHFLMLKYFDFDVCASLFFNGSTNTGFKIGSLVQGTVLCVNPISHMIHITLHSTPVPNHFSKLFQWRKFEIVENPKFLYFYKKRAYYKISKGTFGFINVRDLPSIEGGMATLASLARKDIQKARVIRFYCMDNLVQMTAKPSIVEKVIILPEAVQVGDIYDAIVQKHEEDGMFVKICLGLYGFIRRLHMSDAYVTKPEVLHPVGSTVKCRVLSTDGKGKVNLSCKESILDLEKSFIMSSYHNVRSGQYYKGVVVKKSSVYILVLFFNDIKGIVPPAHIPESSVFFEGQTVLCKVVHCNPLTKSLKLSLKTEEWYQNIEISRKDDNSNKPTNLKRIKAQLGKKEVREIINDEDLSDEGSPDIFRTSSNEPCTSSSKLNLAVIKKVKGQQLNIMLKKNSGRVHVTELGCKVEGVYPLKQFSAKQKIQVYIIGEIMRKNRNFLEISHRNMTSFKECALSIPPASSLKDFKLGDFLIGFVKEVHDVCATIWLSPNKTGVLEYLHFSKSPKIVRKLRRHLKVGLSLKVKILNVSFHSEKGKDRQNITLTRIDSHKPEVGANILGLVQIARFDRGLVLKLPFEYHGSVCITDLADIYVPVHTQLKMYLKLKYVLCHVLEVNHETKYCQLSLRKSRLFQKQANSSLFCPEVTAYNIKEGNTVKGFVKFASVFAITVIIGRKLEGKIQLHNCILTECAACALAKDILNKYAIGSVIDVIILRILDSETCVFTLPELMRKKECQKYDRLSINEDISWEEMQ